MTSPDSIDAELLELLACPSCHSRVEPGTTTDELVCTGDGCDLVYPVRDGIAVMLLDQARHRSESEGVRSS